MILRYLKNCVARLVKGPAHPLYCRTFDVNGELVAANSYDDTAFEQNDPQKCLPVSEQVAAGMRLKPMGVAPSQSMLHDAMVADEFVKRFNAAGVIPSAAQREDVEDVPSPSSADVPADTPAE